MGEAHVGPLQWRSGALQMYFAVMFILLQLRSHGSFSVKVEDDLKLVSQPYFALLRGEQCTSNSCVGHKILQNWALLGP